MRLRLSDLPGLLLKQFGPQHWWPAKTPFEVLVGAVLTQNTAWANVEKAVANLRGAGLLDARKLDAAPAALLAPLIRPSGYFNVKAKRLKSVVRWLVARHGGRVENLRRGELEAVRAELLEVSGVGPETADSILLYAAGRPSFVVDAYTVRILRRHFMLPEEATYEDIQAEFQRVLPEEAPLYNEAHALIVRLAKEHCAKKARCAGCPLERFDHDAGL